MDRTSWLVLVILSTVLVLAGVFTWWLLDQSTIDYAETSAATVLQVTDGEYQDDAGQSVSLLPIETDYLLITTWASWSPFTAADLSTLAQVAEQFSGQSLRVIAMNRAEPVTQAKRALVGLPTVSPAVELIYDPVDHFYRSIGGYAMPETVIFDRRGDIVIHERRQLNQIELVTILEELLK